MSSPHIRDHQVAIQYVAEEIPEPKICTLTTICDLVKLNYSESEFRTLSLSLLSCLFWDYSGTTSGLLGLIRDCLGQLWNCWRCTRRPRDDHLGQLGD